MKYIFRKSLWLSIKTGRVNRRVKYTSKRISVTYETKVPNDTRMLQSRSSHYS